MEQMHAAEACVPQFNAGRDRPRPGCRLPLRAAGTGRLTDPAMCPAARRPPGNRAEPLDTKRRSFGAPSRPCLAVHASLRIDHSAPAIRDVGFLIERPWPRSWARGLHPPGWAVSYRLAVVLARAATPREVTGQRTGDRQELIPRRAGHTG